MRRLIRHVSGIRVSLAILILNGSLAARDKNVMFIRPRPNIQGVGATNHLHHQQHGGNSNQV